MKPLPLLRETLSRTVAERRLTWIRDLLWILLGSLFYRSFSLCSNSIFGLRFRFRFRLLQGVQACNNGHVVGRTALGHSRKGGLTACILMTETTHVCDTHYGE